MKHIPNPRDHTLILLPILIFAAGLFFIYSASWREGRPLDQSLVLRQSFWMLIAVLVMVFSLRFHYRILADIAWPLYGASLVFLVVVLFMPARLGANRWIGLGFFNFQPSELAKLATITVLAAFLKEHRFVAADWKALLAPFFITAVPVLLILKEPDLGTGMIFVPVLFAMLYVWGFKLRWILVMAAIGAVAAPFLFHQLHEYQKNRILIFMNPEIDPLGAGYTIIQSKIAIGSGGLFGKGFLSGTQTQLQFLPEKHTDFIFSVIGEEGGFVGAMVVVVSYWIITYKGYRIAQECNNRFGRLLAAGITTLLAGQALVNMAMTSGLVPVVGMPLLLVSYGGSSLIVTMLLIGVLINIGMRRDPFL
jgi:rod shape determining protein RodA